MTTKDQTSEAAVEPKTRRPYRSPELKALGSLREITWGPSPKTATEGAVMGAVIMMM